MSTLPRCANPKCPHPDGGRRSAPGLPPVRVSGKRFGLGPLCLSCYEAIRRKEERDRRASERAGLVDPEAVRTIEQLRAEANARRAAAEPRRPCPASATGGHRLIQPPGALAYDPFLCADCGYQWTPPDQLPARRFA